VTLRGRELLLPLGLAVACAAEVLATYGLSFRTVSAACLLVGAALSLLGYGRAPLIGPLLCFGLTMLAIGLPLDAPDLVTPQYVLLVVPYLVAVGNPRLRSLAGLAMCVAALSVVNAETAQPAGSWVFALGALAGSFFVGRAIRRQRAIDGRLAAVAERTAAEREENSRLAVEGVRARISEDVNVLVARSIASMIVSSEAAARLVDLDSREASSSMEAIEEMGREALTEMRTVLGSLRRSEVRAG
jgi:signal transduction histidine kinase